MLKETLNHKNHCYSTLRQKSLSQPPTAYSSQPVRIHNPCGRIAYICIIFRSWMPDGKGLFKTTGDKN